MTFGVRPLRSADCPWVRELLAQRWSGPRLVSRGRVHEGDRLPGLVAVHGEEYLGLLTFHVEGPACEIVSLDSVVAGRGIGTALLATVEQVARDGGCRRLWLVTTNDNLPAVRFYQKRGFALVAIHRNALEIARLLKPAIPPIGIDSIPLRDEIELERLL